MVLEENGFPPHERLFTAVENHVVIQRVVELTSSTMPVRIDASSGIEEDVSVGCDGGCAHKSSGGLFTAHRTKRDTAIATMRMMETSLDVIGGW